MRKIELFNKIRIILKKWSFKKKNIFLVRNVVINDSTKFKGDNFVGVCNLENSEIGKHTYIGSGPLPFTKVGRHCSISNDVWIGEQVLIKPSITIGDGAIVGMGSVATHNVDPYTIVAGNPAKVIRKRFDDKKIKKLLDIMWWNWPDEKILNEKEHFIIGDLDER